MDKNPHHHLVRRSQFHEDRQSYLPCWFCYLWHHLVLAVMFHEYLTFEGLGDFPENKTSAESKVWAAFIVKLKLTIVMWFGDSALAKTRNLTENFECTAKAPWDEQVCIYKTSCMEAIANLQAKMEYLYFKECRDWDQHVFEFLSVVDQLGVQDQVISDSTKVIRILRTLRTWFDILAEISSLAIND